MSEKTKEEKYIDIQFPERWASTWAQQQTKIRFRLASKVKMSSQEFKKLMTESTQMGFLRALDYILFKYYLNPTESADELLGDIHIFFMQEYNLLRRLKNGRVPESTIEGILERLQELRNDIIEADVDSIKWEDREKFIR